MIYITTVLNIQISNSSYFSYYIFRQLRKQKNQLQNQQHQSLTDTNAVQSPEDDDLSCMTVDEEAKQIILVIYSNKHFFK